MAERIPAGKAIKEWKALLDRAQRGERIVITRDGKDVATLGPVQQQDIVVRLGAGPAHAPYDTSVTRDILSRAFGKKNRG